MEINMLTNARQIMWAILYGFVWSILGIMFGVIKKATTKEHKLEMFKKKIYSRLGHFQEKSNIKFQDNKWFRNVVDFFFAIFTGLTISIFAYATNDGIMRWFAIFIIALIAWITVSLLYYPICFLKGVSLAFTFAIIKLFYIPVKMAVKFVFSPILFCVYSKTILLFLRICGKIKTKKIENKDC